MKKILKKEVKIGMYLKRLLGYMSDETDKVYNKVIGAEEYVLAGKIKNRYLLDDKALWCFNERQGGRRVAIYGDKAFIVYADVSNPSKIWVKEFDFCRGIFSDKVLIGEATNPAFCHISPSIAVDKYGYLHVVWSGKHPESLKYRRSVNRDDISSWSKIIKIDDTACYPQLQIHQDMMYIWYRPGGHPAGWKLATKKLKESNWRKIQVMEKGNPHPYSWDFAVDRKGGIHIVWTKNYDTVSLRIKKIMLGIVQKYWDRMDRFLGFTYDWVEDVRYAYSPNGGHSWQKKNGENLSLPIKVDGGDCIAKGCGSFYPFLNRIWPSICLDEKDEPVIIFSNCQESPTQLHCATWNGSDWYIEKIIAFNEDIGLPRIVKGRKNEILVACRIKKINSAPRSYTSDLAIFRCKNKKWTYEKLTDDHVFHGFLDLDYFPSKDIYTLIWCEDRKKKRDGSNECPYNAYFAYSKLGG